jgi:hypothetical protein
VSNFIPMSKRISDAGDQAVPMLVDIMIKAAAQACMAMDAMGDEAKPPDLEEVDRRITNIIRLLMTGSK